MVGPYTYNGTRPPGPHNYGNPRHFRPQGYAPRHHHSPSMVPGLGYTYVIPQPAHGPMAPSYFPYSQATGPPQNGWGMYTDMNGPYMSPGGAGYFPPGPYASHGERAESWSGSDRGRSGSEQSRSGDRSKNKVTYKLVSYIFSNFNL